VQRYNKIGGFANILERNIAKICRNEKKIVLLRGDRQLKTRNHYCPLKNQEHLLKTKIIG
jgi:hypothetical protein